MATVPSYNAPRGHTSTLRGLEAKAAQLAQEWAATPAGSPEWWRASVRYIEAVNLARMLRGAQPLTITPYTYARAGMSRRKGV